MLASVVVCEGSAVALAARGGESEADEAGRWLGILGPWPLCPLQETIDVGGLSALVVGLALLPFAGACEFIAISFWLQRSGVIQSALLPWHNPHIRLCPFRGSLCHLWSKLRTWTFRSAADLDLCHCWVARFAHVKRFGF